MGTHALVKDDGRLHIAEFGHKQPVMGSESRRSMFDMRGANRLARGRPHDGVTWLQRHEPNDSPTVFGAGEYRVIWSRKRSRASSAIALGDTSNGKA